MVGFRAWKLHADRLWPVRHSARAPWPTGDVEARCESLDGPWIAPHRSPAPHDLCGCGLYAYHDIESLYERADGADVWGAVLSWGALEVHAEGFRAAWQRPLALAAAPRVSRDTALAHAADRYQAVVAPIDRLAALAREHGDPIPLGLVPVTPLALLAHRAAWESTAWVEWGEDGLPPVLAPGAYSIVALAASAADLATRAALGRGCLARADAALHCLEAALAAVLSAATQWMAVTGGIDMSRDDPGFRAFAFARIAQVLRDRPGSGVFEGPMTVPFRQLSDPAGLPEPSAAHLRSAPGRRAPLSSRQLQWLMLRLAQRGRRGDDLVHALGTLGYHSRRGRSERAFAEKLYRAGSRACGVLAQFLDPWCPDVGVARAVADQPAAQPDIRARALGALAADGTLEDVRRFLSHPLANPRVASAILSDRGPDGVLEARALLCHGALTDAQLSAVVGVLGCEAADAARWRLEDRPAPFADLLEACIAVLPTDTAAAIMSARLRHGEALSNPSWWRVIRRLGRSHQEQLARSLMAHIASIPDSNSRIDVVDWYLSLDFRTDAGDALLNELRSAVMAAREETGRDREHEQASKPTLPANLKAAIELYDGGYYAAALPLLRKAVELFPADPNAWYRLALAADESDQFEVARQGYARVLILARRRELRDSAAARLEVLDVLHPPREP